MMPEFLTRLSRAALVGAVLLAAPALPGTAAAAAATPAASPAPASAPASTPASIWAVDTAQSTLGFETVVYGSALTGSFAQWDARIDFNRDAPETSSVSVVIEMSSADTGDATRNETLKGADWFAVGDHPTATLTSTAFRAAGDDRFEMDADLTIRGVTVPVMLPFNLEDGPAGTRATGSLTIDRTAFGVGQGDFLTGAIVALEVTISIDVVATPQTD